MKTDAERRINQNESLRRVFEDYLICNLNSLPEDPAELDDKTLFRHWYDVVKFAIMAEVELHKFFDEQREKSLDEISCHE